MFIPKGSLAFVGNGSIEFRSPRGAIIHTADLGTAVPQYGAATLDTAIFAADDLVAAVKVFTPLLTSIGSVSFTGPESPGLRATGSLASSQAAFYAGRVNWIVTPTGAKFVATIKRVSDTASDVQTWTLPDAGIGFSPSDTILTGFCVSWDGQTLYYSAINRDLDPSHDLMRYDLNGSTSLSALATDPTFYPSSSLALSDGSVVSLWGTETTAEIRVYNSSGVLLNARPWVVGAGARFTRGRDDTTVWFWSGSGVVQIRVADLDVLESFPVSDSANAGIALFVTRKDAGNKLLSVSFDNGRNIRVDGDPGEYDAPHWQS